MRVIIGAEMNEMQQKEKVIFLDRDGVINKKATQGDYIKSWREFEFLESVFEALWKLNAAGFKVVIATNQRGIARGKMTQIMLEDIHKKMLDALKYQDVHIDQIYYCPHDEGQCNCRKPQTGMLERAERLWDIDKKHSYMIGDSDSDIVAGKSFGVKTIRITDKKRLEIEAEYACKSLLEAAIYITEKR